MIGRRGFFAGLFGIAAVTHAAACMSTEIQKPNDLYQIKGVEGSSLLSSYEIGEVKQFFSHYEVVFAGYNHNYPISYAVHNHNVSLPSRVPIFVTKMWDGMEWVIIEI